MPNSLKLHQEFMCRYIICIGSLTTIAMHAFRENPGFNGLVISSGVVEIGHSAFRGCTGMAGTLTFPNTLTSLMQDSFSECEGFTGDLIIPDTVTVLAHGVFANCRGFNGKLVISSSITEIHSNTFIGCSGLTGNENVSIPSGVTSIGSHAFDGVRLTGSLSIPDTVEFIGAQAFQNCKWTGSLSLPVSLVSIGANAFKQNTGFTSISYYAHTTMESTTFDGIVVIPLILSAMPTNRPTGQPTSQPSTDKSFKASMKREIDNVAGNVVAPMRNVQKVLGSFLKNLRHFVEPKSVKNL